MVPGEGPMPCDLMVLGEAPGRNEVAAGRPFVGPSGRLLDFLLVQFQVVREEEVYITNVYKEMPVDDLGRIRAPYPAECEEHWPATALEIRTVNPKAILLLGTTAYRALVGDWEGKPAWGTTFLWDDRVCGTIWHPSYLLHRGERDFPLWRQQAQPLFDAYRDL